MKKTAIFTLLLLSMTTMMSNVAIVTALPKFQTYFNNIDNIEFYSRLMITLPSLIIALLAPMLGHLIFKIGKKSSAIIALFIFSITGTSGLYLNELEYFLISRALFGISIAILMIVSTSLVGDYFDSTSRHKFMGYQTAFMSIGGFFFVLGGGYLAEISWRWPFGIYFIGLLLLPMVIKFLYEVPKKPSIPNDTQPISNNMFMIYFLSFFYMLIFFILPTQIPFLIIDSFGASEKTAGSIIALAFLSNAFGAITFAKLKMRYSFSTIYMIGLSIVAVGFAAIGLIEDIFFFYFSSPILGFGGGIMMTNLTAWMLSCTTFEKRVKSAGYLTSALFLGQFFSPIVFHPLISFMSVQDFFLVIGGLLFSLILITTFYSLYKLKTH